MTDVLLKPVDVARRLGLSKATVYIMIRTGRLTGVVTMEKGSASPKMMIPESSVVAFEAARTPEPAR